MLLHTFSPKLSPLVEYLEALTAPADLDRLVELLSAVEITREDLGTSVSFKDDCYARNRVALTDWVELVTLCWKPGQRSCIHDHRGAACAFRVIEGSGTEQRYELNKAGNVTPTTARPIPEDTICAAYDADIHEVVNTSDTDLITLHIYTPPLEDWNKYERCD
ncbi:MAG: cysteine dioxygenase family protein [Planctomycetota bacterium]